MLAFGVGTVPALAIATVGLRTLLVRDRRTRRLLALGVLLAGLWVIGGRAGYWNPLLGAGGHSQEAPHENGAP